jgi:hypothetical protein
MSRCNTDDLRDWLAANPDAAVMFDLQVAGLLDPDGGWTVYTFSKKYHSGVYPPEMDWACAIWDKDDKVRYGWIRGGTEWTTSCDG